MLQQYNNDVRHNNLKKFLCPLYVYCNVKTRMISVNTMNTYVMRSSASKACCQAVEIPIQALASGQLIIDWQKNSFNPETDRKS
jgi:hypothetical protein